MKNIFFDILRTNKISKHYALSITRRITMNTMTLVKEHIARSSVGLEKQCKEIDHNLLSDITVIRKMLNSLISSLKKKILDTNN
jgi:hypothetical protein